MNWLEDQIRMYENKLRFDRKAWRIQIGVTIFNTCILTFDIAANPHTMWSGLGIGGMAVSSLWCLFMLLDFYGDLSMSRQHLKCLKELQAKILIDPQSLDKAGGQYSNLQG